MGLILPQTVKVRTSSSNCKHFREKGYEFKKFGDIIEVNVLDLPKGSGVKVKIICDVCGCESEVPYFYLNGNISNNVLITCGSNSCKNKKYENTCMEKYGVKNVLQAEEVKEKIKDTNLERYGAENVMQCKEIQDKAKDTNLGRYGAENPFGSKEIRDKIKNTWQKNYGENITSPSQAQIIKDKIKDILKEKYGEGITCSLQVESVREKSKQTMLNNHGVEYALQNEEIKNKALDSFQFNHTGPSSRAQRYINHILNGTLNKHICGLLVDIYMEKENIIIEHDGRGHFLGDMINGNKTPTKETILKEKRREDKIINNGYRMIRFIAAKDRIPSDEVILNLIEGFKNSDFKVIRINFEEGTIDRDYEERWYCNFGKLRKITKEDLEQFEKQEENTSEN